MASGAFGTQGERLAGLKHGDAAAVAGRATLSAYQTKDGDLRALLSIIADELAAVRRAPKQAKPERDVQQAAFDDLDEMLS